MNYREQTSTGIEWRRCNQVHIYNPLDGEKTCRFDEEDVVSVSDRTVIAQDGYITTKFDPAVDFQLLDPDTGEPTGQSMTHGALYQALYSLYMQTALARDAATPE